MKNKMAWILILSAALLLSAFGCGNKPAPLDSNTQFGRAPGNSAAAAAPALWIATSDYSKLGLLSRLDLGTGVMAHGVRQVNPDIFLAPDSRNGFFLLTRNGSDSVSLLAGSDAHLEASFPLVNFVNPQFAARDSSGKVWIASLESNIVDIISADLRERVGSVDLGTLQDSDGLAELYGVAKSGDTMAVVAARLERPKWSPAANSAIAWIDSKTFQVKESRSLSVRNAVHVFATPDDGFLAVGAGSQDPANIIYGGIEITQPSTIANRETRVLTSRIIASDFSKAGELATVEWRPEESKSCIHFGNRDLVCEAQPPSEGTGYVFSQLVIAGDTVFAAYARNGNSELWMISLVSGEIQKIRMEQPIVSLTLGP